MVRRILARIRSRYPLSFVSAGLLLGQIIGAISTDLYIQIAVAVFGIGLFGCFLLTKRGVGFITAILVGFFSVLILSAPAISDAGDYRYEMRVEERPSRPKPNELRAKLKIISVYSAQEGGLTRIDHEHTGRTILCKGGEVPWRNISGLQQGDIIFGLISLKPFRKSSEPFGYERTMLRAGVSAGCKFRYITVLSRNTNVFTKARESFLRSFRSTFGGSLESGLLLSILLGIRESIPNPVEESFKATGLSHLLVFSGAQVVMIYGFVYWILHAFTLRLQRRFQYYHGSGASSVISLIATIFFVLFIGADKSSMRALIALCVGWCAAKLERGQGLAHAILGAATILLVIWPGSFFEPGVQLTFAALIGIAIGQKLGSSWWICPCVSLTTSIVSVIWFHQISFIGFILNPIIVPLVSGVACTAGVVAILLFTLGIDRNGVLFSLLAIPLGWLEEMIYQAHYLSWASISLGPIASWCIAGVMLGIMGVILLRISTNINHQNIRRREN